jgi:hypothetical protein
MATFGSFETQQEAYSDLVYSVYTARKGDDSREQYAVKVFRLPDEGLEAEVSPGAVGRDELERARLNSIDLQQQTAGTSPFVAPVIERGNDSRGIWYATRFYPRSINKMMSGKVALPRASLEHLIHSIAQGALDLKRACGRSHGDIQPTNIQVGKSDKLTDAEVVLCDPLPGALDQAEAYELNDLRAIGWILLQLVRQRTVTQQDAALMFPIGPGPEWTRVFGNDASNWLALCNRLLDPNLSLNQLNLEALVNRFRELEPKRGVSPKLVAAGIGVLALITILGLWSLRPRPANLEVTSDFEVTSDPPGAVVLVDGTQRAGVTPLELKLKTGTHRLEARLDTLGLSPQAKDLVSGKDTSPTVKFQFDYGRVELNSEPPGASIRRDTKTIGRTTMDGQPFVLTNVPPGAVSFELALDQYETAILKGMVSNGQTLNLSARLRRSEIAKPVETNVVVESKTPTPPVMSTGEVEFRVDPVTASIFDSSGNELGQASPDSPLKRTLPPGKALFTAKSPGLKDVSAELAIEPGAKAQHTFTFEYGTVDWVSEPVPATIRLGAQTKTTPTTFIQQPGVMNVYVATAAGYEPSTNEVWVKSGDRQRLVAKLKPLLTNVMLVSDPPGAEFLTEAGTPLARDKSSGGLFSIPYGLKKVVARHAQLGLVTNEVPSTSAGTGSELRFNFTYGTLVLTNLPANVAVYESDAKVAVPADGVVYQRPGNHRYVLRGQATPQEMQVNIQPGLNYLRLASAEKTWKNSLGMWFAWVPNLPGGGLWPGQNVPGGWVGISEVTQGQYKKMDGSNPSFYRDGGDNYPVENVTLEQAMKYCQWLCSSGAAECGGWRYTLPSDEQFAAFAADADRLARVTAEGRMNNALEDTFPLQRLPKIPAAQNLNNARTHPEIVASTKQANQYGLYDVVGNVSEWLARSGAKENVYAGGSYLNFTQKTVGSRARERTLEKGPNVGFRVILVPPQ